MDAYLQIWGAASPEAIPIAGERTVIGRDDSNDVVLADDMAASRVHAVIERYPAGWTIRDLGSANGTYVNGDRLAAEQALRPGDEIRVGATSLVFRDRLAGEGDRTVTVTDAPPAITRRERDVLVELCRPLLGPGQFAQPASVTGIADALVVSRAAVSFHLDNLYAKFQIAGRGAARRAELANAALNSGAITRGDLRPS
jgi:pSer/pThr/pTyr-binding forkhead associated (FHA) protein